MKFKNIAISAGKRVSFSAPDCPERVRLIERIRAAAENVDHPYTQTKLCVNPANVNEVVIEIIADASDVTVGGPIHRNRCLQAARAAYCVLESAFEKSWRRPDPARSGTE
jgi:hypothetical protein